MTTTSTSGDHRIIVVGPSCSGKSTLAESLAGLLDVPFVELDALYWKPGWTHPTDDEFRANLCQATAGDGWVVAGGYHRHSSLITWPRAQMVVWLDFPMRTIVPRIIARSWKRWRSHELLWGTNTEDFWSQLKIWDQRSLIAFAFTQRRTNRERYIAAMADPQWAHIRFVRLRSPREIRDFVHAFAQVLSAASTSHR